MIFSIWYIPYRLRQLFAVRKTWLWRLAVAVIFGGYMLLLNKGVYTWDNALTAVVYNILGLLFVFATYLFFFLLLTHPLQWLKRQPKRLIGIAGVSLSTVLVVWGFINAQSFTVTYHDLPVKGLDKPVKIIHLPDIHLGTQRGETYLKKILQVIETEKPDIVLYNGDLVDSDIALKPELFSLFKAVKSEQYFTTGNHEFYMDTDKALRLIADAGIKIVRSEMVKTNGIQLIGLEYMNADRQTYDAHIVNDLTVQEELPKIERDRNLPTVVVHHSPVGMRYVADGGADVMLSGHTHAGQFFPGTAIIKYRFPMYRGQYQIGGLTLLVSQGAGTFGPWIRLGTSNEVQVVNLSPKI